MTLPVIPDLPIPPLPIEIPLLMHPVVVHFAIVIPVIVLLIELANLIAKRRALSITSLSLIILMMVIYVDLFITGKTDGSEGAIFLSDEGLADFKAHKLLGLYLIYSTVIVFIFKLVAMLTQKPALKIFFVVLLLGFVGLNMFQGKEGGELVYKFGMNNAALSDANDKLEEITDELDELKAELEDSKELTCKEVQESIDVILEEEATPEKAQEVQSHVEDNSTEAAKPIVVPNENGAIKIEDNSTKPTPIPASEPIASQEAA
jgi:uncharacterized membrane protein